MQYAGFWIRVVAYLIDAIALYILNLLVGLVFGVSIGAMSGFDTTDGQTVQSTAFVGAYGMILILNVLYFALLESSARQATLGKMAVGLIVTDERGNRIGLGRALGRYLAKILSGLILLIGFIMVAFTDRKRGLHDMLAGTLVLKGRPGEGSVDPGVFA